MQCMCLMMRVRYTYELEHVHKQHRYPRSIMHGFGMFSEYFCLLRRLALYAMHAHNIRPADRYVQRAKARYPAILVP